VSASSGVGEISTGFWVMKRFLVRVRAEMSKRKLAKAEQERDFLRDAAVFFAKESK
jgi:hypothetical protein